MGICAPGQEKFAQELATGKTADAAYVLAGYRANRSNAARLSANRDIQKRVAEIQSVGAELAAITVETLIAEAEAARSKAMGEKGGANREFKQPLLTLALVATSLRVRSRVVAVHEILTRCPLTADLS